MHYGRLIRFLGLLALYIYMSPEDNPLDKVLVKNTEKVMKIVEKGVKGKKVDLVIVAPSLDVNKDLYVREQDVAVVTTENLNCFDKDSSDDEIKYYLLKLPEAGKIYLNEKEMQEGEYFTQADLRSEKLLYKHIREGALKDEFGFSLQDKDGAYAKNANSKKSRYIKHLH